MSEVIANENENFESVLRRFNKKVMLDGVIREAKRRGAYEKPSDRRRREANSRRRKLLKKQLRAEARALSRR